jgi:hypothetical protein
MGQKCNINSAWNIRLLSPLPIAASSVFNPMTHCVRRRAKTQPLLAKKTISAIALYFAAERMILEVLNTCSQRHPSLGHFKRGVRDRRFVIVRADVNGKKVSFSSLQLAKDPRTVQVLRATLQMGISPMGVHEHEGL